MTNGLEDTKRKRRGIFVAGIYDWEFFTPKHVNEMVDGEELENSRFMSPNVISPRRTSPGVT